MSGIARRTVYYENDKDGYIRPHDWALVTTGIGSMVEPKLEWFPRTGNNSLGPVFNPSDDISRIDSMKEYSRDREPYIMGDALHGGCLYARSGR